MSSDASETWSVLDAGAIPVSDTDGLRAAARGDSVAIAQLYHTHHRDLRDFAGRLLGDPHAAEDLVHDVFVALPKALCRFREECTLRTYLRAMAIQHARRHLRAALRRRAAMSRLAQEIERSARLPSDELQRRELARQLTRCLDRLSLKHRGAFVLCEVEGFSSDEAAIALGVKPATLRTRLFHARRKLSELLGGTP